MNGSRRRLTLDRPAIYQIRVPGEIDASWADWAGDMSLTIEGEEGGLPMSTITGSLDQAALHGLLRRLYSLGLPLISVICIELDPDGRPSKSQE